MEGWTLFLDRDGVINERLENDYVKTPDEFTFITGVLPALKTAKELFSTIVIVTNQRGISLGKMTTNDLDKVHKKMMQEIITSGGRIDKIYFCPDDQNSPCRKPNTGMAQQAKIDFPGIDFKKSYIAGDSTSDLEFGRKLGMKTAYISNLPLSTDNKSLADIICPDLITFTNELLILQKKSASFFTTKD